MLTSVACACARSGRKIAAANFSRCSAALEPNCARNVTCVRHSSLNSPSRLATPAPWKPPCGPPVRYTWASSRVGEDQPQDSSSTPKEDENFGSMSTDMSSRRSYRKSSPQMQDMRLREDNVWDEEEEQEARPRSSGRNTTYWYFLQCKKLIKDNKLQEALDLFGREMLQGERLQPEEYNYSVLIGACGRAGELKRAFKLYNDLKKRGLKASDATYTALFNACAESPSKHVGLQQALKLEQELRRKSYPLSTITYHALLKAHAVTNHLQACLHTLREMLQNGHAVTQETLHYLLMSCVKDKEIGFRLALQVWRQMLKSGILPDSMNYNLLLRIARDCGIGDPALAAGVLLGAERECQKKSERLSRRAKPDSQRKNPIDVDLLERQLFIQADPFKDGQQPSGGSEEEAARGGRDSSKSLVPVSQTENTLLPVDAAPNLLDLFEGGGGGGIVSFGAVNGASDRLALIGGGEGFLEKMAAGGLTPDLRTLTLLADTMQPGHQSLQMLLKVAKQHRVKLDVAFFNSVIRRAARSGDFDGAKAVLAVMRQRNVKVDVQTFGSLALGCERQKDGLQLLRDMEEAGLRPNVQVFSALIGLATRRLDYVYLKTILQSMSELKVWPNEVIIKQLEFAAQYPPNYNQYKSRNNYLVHIDGFRGYYQLWLRAMPAQDAEGSQAGTQPETGPAELDTRAADGLTESQRNQRAAARRYNSANKDKTSGSAATVLQQR